MLSISQACERNKDPILAVLSETFAACKEVLEIGSGTGQHAVYLAARLPHLRWHATERLAALPDLAARIATEGGPNLAQATVLDVSQSVWPVPSVDAVFTANTLHILSWAQVTALFRGIGRTLASGGTVCIYGPFRYDGRYTSPSNAEFDRVLQARDSESALRDIAAVTALATGIGLRLTADHDLPAFNRMLVFIKES